MEKYYILIPISKWNESKNLYWTNINENGLQFLEYICDLLYRNTQIYLHLLSSSVFFLSFELERSAFKTLLKNSFQSKKRKHQIECLVNFDGIQRKNLLKTYLSLIPGFLLNDDYESILNCFHLESMQLILNDLYPLEDFSIELQHNDYKFQVSKDYFKNPTQLLPNYLCGENSEILTNLFELLPILYRKPILDKEIYALVTQRNLKFLTNDISLKSICKWDLFDLLHELTKYTTKNLPFKKDLTHLLTRVWDVGCIEFQLSPTFEKLKRWIYTNRFGDNKLCFEKSKSIINKIDGFTDKLWQDVFFRNLFHNPTNFKEYLSILYPCKTGNFDGIQNKHVQSICIPQFLTFPQKNLNDIQQSPLLSVFHDLQFLTLLTYEMQFAGFIPQIPKEKINSIVHYILDQLKPFLFISIIESSFILKTIETMIIINSWIQWLKTHEKFEISSVYTVIKIENLSQIIIQSILYWCSDELSPIKNIIKKRGKKFETLYSTIESHYKTKEEALHFINNLSSDEVHDKKIMFAFLNAIPFKSIDHTIKINEKDTNQLKLVDLNYFTFSFPSELDLYNDIYIDGKSKAISYLQSKNMRLPKEKVFKYQILSDMTPYRIDHRNLNSLRYDSEQYKKWIQLTFPKIFKTCEKGEIMDTTIRKKFKSNLPIWKYDSNKTYLYISSHYCLYFSDMEQEMDQILTSVCLKLMKQTDEDTFISYVQSSSFQPNELKKILIKKESFREENRLISIKQKDSDILTSLFGQSIGLFRQETDESIRLQLNQSIDDLIQDEYDLELGF